MPELPAHDLVPEPDEGRIYRSERRVRFGDADRTGRIRLDTLATYLQDIAADDTREAECTEVGWVVRRNVFEVLRPPAVGEVCVLSTWGSGSGRRWAERRFSAKGPSGSDVEGVSLWVTVSPDLRPVPLPDHYVKTYADAIGGRIVSSRLQHPTEPAEGATVDSWRWALRATDLDPYEHVNNAAAWAIVEEAIARSGRAAPFRAEIEHRTPIEPRAEVAVDVVDHPGGELWLWVRDTDDAGVLYLSARVAPTAA